MGIVVISRQAGSSGDEIAALAANSLGYRLITREDVHRLAMACDDEFKKACSIFEAEIGPGVLERFFFNEPANTSLFESLNYQLASEGNVVILGRGAQIVLADTPGVLKVRLVSPAKIRAQRIMESQGISHEEAVATVNRYDKKRRGLIESVFHKDLSDWALYDVVINTAAFSKDGAAEVICRSAEQIVAPVDAQEAVEKLKKLSFAKKIESHIKKHVFTTTYRNLTVEVEPEGVVTLKGAVQEKRSKKKAESLAAEIPGVTQVINELGTTELTF